ncbi:MAG: RNA ligase family protein [Burkholderiales bacterium]|nr:RNA ligase family protein [Burkholderiales bacterium]
MSLLRGEVPRQASTRTTPIGNALSVFFRFPHTPHLAWLGPGTPRDDKVLATDEAAALLAGEVVVEEKLDGANLGVSLAEDGTPRFQNRGQYLHPPFAGQFQRLGGWITAHGEALRRDLSPGLIVFGEWCAARHSVAYDRLPGWLIVFDVYDRTNQRFFSTARRDAVAKRLGLAVVRNVSRGHTTLADLTTRLTTETSRYRTGPIEGFVIRKEASDWLLARAKLVHPEFVQSIGEHWRRRRIEWNRLEHGTTGEPAGGAVR